MGRALTFKQKEVINLTDGRRLGYVQDVEANFETGEITAIIVPGTMIKLGVAFSKFVPKKLLCKVTYNIQKKKLKQLWKRGGSNKKFNNKL